MRVLALVPGGVREQLLFFPTLERLKQAFPKAEMTVVAEPEALPAYRVSTLIKETFPYRFDQNNSPADWANLLGVIRDREYEVALTATRSPSLALLLWLSGIPTRIGYQGSGNTLLLTATVPAKAQQYQAYEYYDLLSPLGIGGPCPAPTINVPQKDIDWVSRAVNSQGLGDQGYVLFYGGPAADPSGETYPLESWAAILQDFQARQPTLPLVLLQQPETAEWTKELLAAFPQVKAIRPENLGQVAALIAGANLMITTDNYPLPLGIALQVFTLALLGQGDAATRCLPSPEGAETRFVGIASPTGTLAGLDPAVVLKKVWGEG